MPYKYNETVKDGAEELIDDIKYMELFFNDEDHWNFHDSEIRSLHWDADKRTVKVTVEPLGCSYEKLKRWTPDKTVLLDFIFIDVLEIYSNCPVDNYITEIEISKYNGYLECWFNGYCIRITSKRLRFGRPRLVTTKK